MSAAQWQRFEGWRDRQRAARLRRLARFCQKVARNAENLADALSCGDALDAVSDTQRAESK